MPPPEHPQPDPAKEVLPEVDPRPTGGRHRDRDGRKHLGDAHRRPVRYDQAGQALVEYVDGLPLRRRGGARRKSLR